MHAAAAADKCIDAAREVHVHVHVCTLQSSSYKRYIVLHIVALKQNKLFKKAMHFCFLKM
jgi:hypothetical protein